jgi:hypothetical protein
MAIADIAMVGANTCELMIAIIITAGAITAMTTPAGITIQAAIAVITMGANT